MPDVPRRPLSPGEQSALRKAQQSHAASEALRASKGYTPRAFDRLRPVIVKRKGY